MDIYDAQVALRGKKWMPRIKSGDLKLHDVVIAEATISRWPLTDKSEPKSGRYRRS